MEENKDSSKDSDFNSSLATLERIHEIKKMLDVSTTKEEPDEQYFYCKAFWKELDCIISKSEQEKLIKKYEDNSIYYNNYKKKTISKEDIIACLDDWEIEMRRIDQAHSLNMKMGRDKRWVV